MLPLHSRMQSAWTIFTVALLTSIGCSGPTVVPVTGKVTLKGQPLAKATVTFIPTGVEGGATSVAVSFTDAEGKFTLQTRLGSGDKMGTVPGTYRVAVSKFVPPQALSEADYQKKLDEEHALHQKGIALASPVPPRHELIPAEFSDTQRSKLTATVKADGKNEFLFEIP
jgi:hypothetical protein